MEHTRTTSPTPPSSASTRSSPIHIINTRSHSSQLRTHCLYRLPTAVLFGSFALRQAHTHTCTSPSSSAGRPRFPRMFEIPRIPTQPTSSPLRHSWSTQPPSPFLFIPTRLASMYIELSYFIPPPCHSSPLSTPFSPSRFVRVRSPPTYLPSVRSVPLSLLFDS